MGISQFACLRLSEPGLQQLHNPLRSMSWRNASQLNMNGHSHSRFINSFSDMSLFGFVQFVRRTIHSNETNNIAKSTKGKHQHLAHSFSAARLFGFGRKIQDFGLILCQPTKPSCCQHLKLGYIFKK